MRSKLRGIRSLIFAILVLAFFLAPLAWMALTAAKSPQQIATRPADALPTTLVVQREGEQVAVEIVAETQGPAALVRDASTQTLALIPLEVAERSVAVDVVRTLPDPEAVYALVQPINRTSNSFVMERTEITHRLSVRAENIPEALQELGNFPRYLRNTLFVCLMQVLGQLVAASIAAYGFAVLNWKGREALFSLLLATLMIPFPVLMIPLYDLFRSLGWLGSLKPLWVPALFASAFNVFLLRQFFLGLPASLFEAARLDGCSELGILWRVVVPLSKPVLTTIVLFQFLFAWNDFLGPFLFLTEREDYTISIALQFLQTQHGGIEWHLLMAASLVTAAPVIVLFFFAQRFLIGGVTMGGMK